MATHDYNLANQSGASFRSDLNNVLAAILSNNSNASDPSTTVAFMTFADTNASKLKIRNSANDAFIDLINLDGSIARDLQLTGAGANILFDQSDNALEFNDNAKATFGTGADLTISHDGSNSIINDSGTGELQLQRGGNTILSLDSSGIAITDPNGSAKISITGFEGGNANINLVSDQGDDNGDTWIISSTASNNNYILYNDESGGNVAKWQLTKLGVVVMSNDLQLPDKIIHIGDTDTSMRFPSADTISFETGGSERARFDSLGNFLVGNTTAVPSTIATFSGGLGLNSTTTGSGSSGKLYFLSKVINLSTTATDCLIFNNWGSAAFHITVLRKDTVNPAGGSVHEVYLGFKGSGINITQAAIAQEDKVSISGIHNITFSISENNDTATLKVTSDSNAGEAQTLNFHILGTGNSAGTVAVA